MISKKSLESKLNTDIKHECNESGKHILANNNQIATTYITACIDADLDEIDKHICDQSKHKQSANYDCEGVSHIF